MTSQIFKIEPPIKTFHEFIQNNATFSSSKFISKKMYVEREMKYKNLITIIRQICRYHHIPFSSNIKYSKSKYEITYSIIIPEPPADI